MSETPGAAEVEPSGRSGHHWLWREGVFLLIAALIGGLAGAGGSYFGARAVVQSSRDQINAAEEQTVRGKRATVYAAYLDAANAFSVKERIALDFVKKQPKGFKPSADREPFNRLQGARYDYQVAINDLSVYGTDTAWDAHLQVAAALPPSLGGLVVGPVDSRAFTKAFQDFLTVFCQEVPAIPRARCDR